jgi:integrase
MMALAGRARRAGNGAYMENRFQSGCLFKRGKRRKVWVGRWREPQKKADGSIGAVQRSEIIGTVAELTKSEAQRLLMAKLAPLNSGMVRPGSVITFGDFAMEWKETVLPSYRLSTRNFYRVTLDRWLIPFWSEWRLSDIRLVDVRKWLNSHSSAYASSVVKHMRATLSKMLSDAVEMSHLASNPAKGFRTPRGKAVKRAVALTREQIAVVVARLKEPLRTAVRLVSILGMRQSELAALRLCDLDFLAKTISVGQSRYRGHTSETKTEGSTRILPMPATVESAEGLLFCNPAGNPLNFDNVTRDVFRPLADAAEIPRFTWRSFRRAVSTQMHRDGIPVKVAQAVLGHANPQVTLGIYTETDLDDMRLAVGVLEKKISQNIPGLVQ